MPDTDRNNRDRPVNAPLPPEKRRLEEREKRTLPMRRVYLIVLMAVLLVLVVVVLRGVSASDPGAAALPDQDLRPTQSASGAGTKGATAA
jgi:hypothetical protein